MPTYILDTDALSLEQEGVEPISSRILSTPPTDLFTTAIIVTRNVRDFNRIPNLIVEGWMVP